MNVLYLVAGRDVKGSKFRTKNLRTGSKKNWTLILYNFDLKILRILMGCEEATRDMAH